MEYFTHTYRHTEPLHTQTHIQYQQVKIYWSIWCTVNCIIHLFIYFNYLCFTFIGVPQVYSKGLRGMELN